MADTDEEQIEAIKEWWRENGTAVIVGIVVGIAALVGWRGWSEYQENRATEASSLYQEIIEAHRNNNTDLLQEKGSELTENYTATPYAGFAALVLAQQAVANDDLATAESQLRLALDSLDEASMKHVARLRLLRILAAREQYEDALSMLDKTDYGQFTGEYEELRGDILLSQNDISGARNAYQLALANTRPQAEGREFLEMKIDSLGKEDGTPGAGNGDTDE